MSVQFDQEKIQALVHGMTQFLHKSEEGDNPTPLEPSQVWPVLYQIAESDSSAWEHLFAIISHYVGEEAHFRATQVDFIDGKITEFLNAEKEKKKNLILPIIRLIPFLPNSKLVAIFTQITDLTKSLIEEESSFPKKFLAPFDDCIAEALDPEGHEIVSRYFLTTISNPELSIPIISVFSKIIFGLLTSPNGDDATILQLSQESTNIVRDFLGGDKQKQIAGCYFLEYLVEYWQTAFHHSTSETTQTLILGTELYAILSPLLRSPDATIRKFALHAAQNAANFDHVLKTVDVLTVLFAEYNLYSNVSTDLIIVFFKLLSCMVDTTEEDGCDCCESDDEDEGPNLAILEPVLQFVSDLIAAPFDLSNLNVNLAKSYCLDTLASIVMSAEDDTLIEDLIEPSLSLIEELVKAKQYLTYPAFSTFLTLISQSESFEDTEIVVKTLNQVVPLMIDSFADSINTEADICNKFGKISYSYGLAADLSALIKKGFGLDKIEIIYNFSIKFIETLTLKDCQIAIQPLHNIAKQLKTEQCNRIYELITPKFNLTKEIEPTGTFLSCLGRLLKYHQILASEDIAKQIIEGTFPILRLNQTNLFKFEPFLAAYKFLGFYVKQFPTKSEKILIQIIEWLRNSKQALTAEGTCGLFLILKQLIDNGVVKTQETFNTIAQIIKPILIELSLEDIDLVSEIIPNLRALYQNNKECLVPYDEIISALSQFASIDLPEGEDEEAEEIMDQLETVMPELCLFVFEIYLENENVPVDDEMLKNLIQMMPFPPQEMDGNSNNAPDETNQMEEIMGLLLQMMADKSRFENILVDGCKLLAELLLLKKNEIEEYQFSDDLIKKMKETLKKTVKGNKVLERKVTKDFAGQRAKLTRFNALIK